MRFYSIIVPVYNRPNEIEELLHSLTRQTYQNFEVIIVDDGSASKSDEIASQFEEKLSIKYFWKENGGQGLARNFGYEKAKGDYWIVFDSDCIIPPEYLNVVEKSLDENYLDAFGGPDKADTSFTYLQRAIDFTMTSVLTTGGIRGKKSKNFTPRSFNMGISPDVFEKTGGYILPKMGEDIEFSLRIKQRGFRVGLIRAAFVYHKRRTNLIAFFKQLHFFGRARINVLRLHPDSIKITYFFPMFFTLGLVAVPIIALQLPEIAGWIIYLYFLYTVLIFLAGLSATNNILIAILAVPASLIQLTAYGIGFIAEGVRWVFGRRK